MKKKHSKNRPKSKFLDFVKKYPQFKKIYYFYNIYIRNYKFLSNGSQFGEEKIILNFFDKGYKGKFVDIGCFHPTRHNNTYKMYKCGWYGINIDLNPLTIDLFDFARARDININAAISDNEENKTLYFVDELNTQNTLEINHLSFLKNHHNLKEEEISEQIIKTKRLDKILDNYNFNDIDFMNIDVEGHELNILNSIDFFKYKIKFICIEMIDHNDQAKLINEKLNVILERNGYVLEKKIDFNFIFRKINYDKKN
ncbi:FkbM family methyltransferase [Candidatus Pelagibacter sp.]|nr:FkbM family methyltransferase [Candidatus Pelagibacter sp.]